MTEEFRPIDPENLDPDMDPELRALIEKGGNLHLVSNHSLVISDVTPHPDEGDGIFCSLNFRPNHERLKSADTVSVLLSLDGAETLAWDLLSKVKEARQ